MTNPQKETLRHAVLEILAIRHPAALRLSQIRRAVAAEVDFHFEESDLLSSLEMLKGLSLAASLPDDLGGTLYWSATPQGVLSVERS